MVILDAMIPLIGDHIESVHSFDHRYSPIRKDIGDTIGDDEAFQIVLGDASLLDVALQVVKVDMPREIRNIESTIALASNIQRVILLIPSILWELLVPDSESFHSIACNR